MSDDAAIQSFIEAVTSITKKELELCRSGDIECILISRRMQLAYGRQVTREEDKSYSLMGILGANISITYGEGSQHAFNRLIFELQEHILDIFNRDYDYSNKLIPSSLELYASRDAYFDTSDYTSGTSWDQYRPFKPIILTHIGVRIPLLLAPVLLSQIESDPNYVPYGGLSGIQPGSIQYLLHSIIRQNWMHFITCWTADSSVRILHCCQRSLSGPQTFLETLGYLISA